MRFDTVVESSLGSIETDAAALEQLGYGGIHVTELNHDPFISAALVARATSTAEVGTQIAVAFARNPMTVAVSARDLRDLSSGRFTLGLGTQVEAHITRRFSMPWSKPADRMADFVEAIRAIWESWETGARLRYEGEFYRHTLMTPAFSPGPAGKGLPPIHLAAVGKRMAATAGRVADGVLVHPFCTPRYLSEVLLPAVESGRAESSREQFIVSAPVFVVSGASEADRAATEQDVRQRIAFYGSTPAYRTVLELHGWGSWGDRLHELSVARDPGKWAAMGDLINDEVLDAFAVAAEPTQVLPAIAKRYDGLIDRAVVPTPVGVDAAVWAAALAEAQRPA